MPDPISDQIVRRRREVRVKMASSLCGICHLPLGYDKTFVEREHPTEPYEQCFVHTSCTTPRPNDQQSIVLPPDDPRINPR